MFSAREIERDDLELIMRWRMDPNITKWMNTDPVLTMEDQLKWFERIQDNATSRYWLIEVNGQPAGVLSLFDIDRDAGCAEWGYYIGDASLRSMPLAISIELSLYAFCFEDLHLSTVYNRVLSQNEGVIQLHKLCGNKVTEVRSGAVVKNGESFDQVCMEIDARTWNSMSLPSYERLGLA